MPTGSARHAVAGRRTRALNELVARSVQTNRGVGSSYVRTSSHVLLRSVSPQPEGQQGDLLMAGGVYLFVSSRQHEVERSVCGTGSRVLWQASNVRGWRAASPLTINT